MVNPIVSIGMPVFNGHPYVRDAISSLLSQSFKDFELIISDNCSTDGTLEMIENLAKVDNRIKFFKQQENKGGLFNFEFVKSKAKGKYFMWAAHDDVWEKNHICEAVQFLEGEPNVGFVFPTFRLKSIRFKLSVKMDKEIFRFLEAENAEDRVIGYCNLHHASHKCNLVYSLFRKEIFNEVYKSQNLDNDGLLSSLILGKMKGKILENYTFQKRYINYWPGFLFSEVYFLKKLIGIRIPNNEFEKLSSDATEKLIDLYPGYERQLRLINRHYKLNSYLPNYKIVNL